LKFERADWTSFRTVEGLQQKAGVPASKLRRLVLKELVDNALDTGTSVAIGERHSEEGGGYFVEDEGPGIDGRPEQIARLFSIARPMVSTKLLRLPTRGALGNGLRVVAGAVLASDGFLVVTTGSRRIELHPERDGSTTVIAVTPVEFPLGTRIEIGFGPAIPEDADALYWAEEARYMVRGQTYVGKSSPFWYDVPQFHELLSASGAAPVRELVARLDGCTGGKAGEIVTAAGLGRMACGEVNREQAASLLQVARDSARAVNPKRLGAIGPELFPDRAYSVSSGLAAFGTKPQAEAPFLVEAWIRESRSMQLLVCVNRTPITGDVHAKREKRDVGLIGCGLAHVVAEAPKDRNFTIRLNITTPYMPITSDGKEPNLKPFLGEICNAVAKAVRKARRPDVKEGTSQKEVVLDNLDDAIAEVSGEEGYLFGERQLFYRLRAIVREETGEELKIANFKKIITDYENEIGHDIPLMYHEPRGSITHPHRNETITLGTLMVEEYERPAWTFNKLLYIEKEGAMEALKQNRWSERHDCAVMSSKGFSTRAARDLIDKLVEHDEPVEVFCVHDADASGTMIYQTLQEETKARGARKIKIINLGLEPWEAVEIGLEVETLDEKERQKPVADYVRERDDGDYWANWLQTNRVELNAMTTPQFIEWLDEKMATSGSGKLIPPDDVLEQELADRIESKVRAALIEHILEEAGLERQIADAFAAIKMPGASSLGKKIKALFKRESDREWRDAIETVAIALIARKAFGGGTS
jgi:Topoisomerase 6 subunit A/Spo11, Toprim domain